MSPSVVCDGCGDRERKGMMDDGECRDCRGVASGRSDYATETANPHAEQASRHRVISNTVGRGL